MNPIKKQLNLFLVTMLFVQLPITTFCTASSIEEKVNTYSIVGNTVISALNSPAKNTQNNTVQSETPKETVQLEIVQLSDHEKRERVFDLFSTIKQSTLSSEDLNLAKISPESIKELELLYGNGAHTQSNVWNLLNKTETTYGQAALASMLVNPLYDVKAIKARQALIKELVENSALFEEIQLILKNVAAAESATLSFWGKDNKLTQSIIDKQYFSKLPSLNKNSYALETTTRIGNTLTGLNISSELLQFATIKYIALRLQGNKDASFSQAMIDTLKSVKDAPLFLWNYLKSLHPENIKANLSKGLTEYVNQINIIQSRDGLPHMTIDQYLKDIGFNTFDEALSFDRKIRYGIAGTLIIGGVICITLYINKVKNALDSAALNKNTINSLQSRLIGVGTLIRSARQIDTLAQSYPTINDGLCSTEKLHNIFTGNNQSSTPEFNSLINRLQTNTFTGQASFFSLSGKVLASYKQMESVKNECAELMESIGELDACLSIAKTYKEYATQRVGFTFVNFVESEKPYLSAQDFWNPFVDPATVITNSIQMGHGTDTRNILLTGSNTGGKSTILKALTLNIILAQTFGIASAQEFTLTPFSSINSYLNISDDTASGNSLFKAEVLRAKTLDQRFNELKKDDFAFVVIDELFTGTSAEKGEQAAYNFTQKQFSRDNVMCILATHFPLLTQLEKTTHGLCINYKVEAYIDNNNNIVRPFKIERGISLNNIAQNILQEALGE